jgi:hypothetical protein
MNPRLDAYFQRVVDPHRLRCENETSSARNPVFSREKAILANWHPRCDSSNQQTIDSNFQRERAMSDYHQLSTEKYVKEVQQQELAAIRVQQNKAATAALIQFSFALVIFAIAMYVVIQMPNWMPAIGTWLEQAGVLKS